MDWFERLTGFREDGYLRTQSRLHIAEGRLHSDTRDRSFAVGRLELVSLADLRERTSHLGVGGRLHFGETVGDARKLHADPINARATFQVASQFNLLEMTSPEVTPEHGVARYAYDPTQGPACAIAAGSGTIYRNYLVPMGDQRGQTATRQLDGLADLGAELCRQIGVAPGTLWQMRNGYALPSRAQLIRIDTHLRGLEESDLDHLRSLLRVGFHADVEVTEAGAAPDTLVSQIYCSALPVSYSHIAARHWTTFATLILEAAYEATLRAALLNAAAGGSPRLLLTRLGGGAFGNDGAWIDGAIQRAINILADRSLDVLMVKYG